MKDNHTNLSQLNSSLKLCLLNIANFNINNFNYKNLMPDHFREHRPDAINHPHKNHVGIMVYWK